MKAQHFVPAEHIIALPIRQEIRIFHRPDPIIRAVAARSDAGEVGVSFHNQLVGPFDGFIEQAGEALTVSPLRVLNGLLSSPRIVPNQT